MTHGSLALKLRVLRAEKALTIEQAAARAGVTPETISDAERGRRHPYLPTLRKLAKAYNVPVEELLSAEEVASSATPWMDHPRVQEWLIDHRHMSREEFLSWAGELESLQEVEHAIAELYETREALLSDLDNREVRKGLFLRRSGLPTKEERIKEALRPARDVWKLKWEIRREYGVRENALVNYSRVLFIEGAADDYLIRSPSEARGEHDHEHHKQMLEARRRVLLEEKY